MSHYSLCGITWCPRARCPDPRQPDGLASRSTRERRGNPISPMAKLSYGVLDDFVPSDLLCGILTSTQRNKYCRCKGPRIHSSNKGDFPPLSWRNRPPLVEDGIIDLENNPVWWNESFKYQILAVVLKIKPQKIPPWHPSWGRKGTMCVTSSSG